MNKKKKTILITSLTILLVGVGSFFGIRQYMRSLPPRGEPVIQFLSGGGDPCLVSSETNYFIATSKLIVKGKFAGEADGPQFVESILPFVTEGFHVTEVYKGDCEPGDDIKFVRVGGEVSLYKMLREAEKLGIENAAYEQIGGCDYPKGLKSWDLKRDVIFKLDATAKTKYALPSDGGEYILFLSFSPEWNTYFLGARSQNYHIRKINERGQLLNPFTENYETIDWEVASKLTKEDVLPGFVSDYDARREEFEGNE